MKVCPQCGQTLPGLLPGVRLIGLKRLILEYVHRAGKHGIRADLLCDKIYADRDDGGPERPMVTMYSTIHRLNQLLRPYELRIVGEQAGGSKECGLYRLVEIPTKK